MPSRNSRPTRDLLELLPNAAWRQRFRRRLLAWFRRTARDLPWRRSADPYWVWVSEIMLQQTQAATVGPYFERFIARFPDIAALASASEEEVLRLWEGLGYYGRARRLYEAARVIVNDHGGRFPRQPEAVRALPGVGRYTAGAILSIAWDAREPILEANSQRVLSRLLAYRQDPTESAGQRLLWAFADQLLPRSRVGDFNQALMELGSEICTHRAPRCMQCPVAAFCLARDLGLQQAIPAGKKKTRYEEVQEAAVVVRRRGKILVRRYAPGQRWAGLWDFPRFPVEDRTESELSQELVEQIRQLTGVTVQIGRRLAAVKHGVTRFRITLSCYEAVYVFGRARRKGQELKWVSPAELETHPLSATGRRISRIVTGERVCDAAQAALFLPAGGASIAGSVVKPSEARSCKR